MNLRRVYPYVPDSLNRVLLRFSAGATRGYDRLAQVVDDLGACADQLGVPPLVSLPVRAND